jgi:hypothetical protein
MQLIAELLHTTIVRVGLNNDTQLKNLHCDNGIFLKIAKGFVFLMRKFGHMMKKSTSKGKDGELKMHRLDLTHNTYKDEFQKINSSNAVEIIEMNAAFQDISNLDYSDPHQLLKTIIKSLQETKFDANTGSFTLYKQFGHVFETFEDITITDDDLEKSVTGIDSIIVLSKVLKDRLKDSKKLSYLVTFDLKTTRDSVFIDRIISIREFDTVNLKDKHYLEVKLIMVCDNGRYRNKRIKGKNGSYNQPLNKNIIIGLRLTDEIPSGFRTRRSLTIANTGVPFPTENREELRHSCLPDSITMSMNSLKGDSMGYDEARRGISPCDGRGYRIMADAIPFLNKNGFDAALYVLSCFIFSTTIVSYHSFHIFEILLISFPFAPSFFCLFLKNLRPRKSRCEDL